MRLFVLTAAALAGVSCAAAAPTQSTTRVTLASAAAGATVGTPWRATVVVRPARAGRPRVTLRGPVVRAAALRRTAPGRYRLTAVFPSPGRWRVEARLAGRTFVLQRSLLVRPAAPAPFALRTPVQLVLDPAGNLVVTDNERWGVVRIAPSTGAAGVVAALTSPYGLAIDPAGGLYATSDDRLLRIAPDGSTSEVARSGNGLDIGPVAVDGGGDVFFVASGRIYRVLRGSTTATHWGGTGVDGFGGDGGAVENATFGRPHGLAFARDGALLVADSENGRIRRVDPATRVVTTLVSGLDFAGAIAAGPDGSYYVTEVLGNRVRRVAPDGGVTVFAGTGAEGSSGDGGPATQATFAGPIGVAVSADGTVYVAEAESGRIRRIDPSGTIGTLALRSR